MNEKFEKSRDYFREGVIEDVLKLEKDMDNCDNMINSYYKEIANYVERIDALVVDSNEKKNTIKNAIYGECIKATKYSSVCMMVAVFATLAHNIDVNLDVITLPIIIGDSATWVIMFVKSIVECKKVSDNSNRQSIQKQIDVLKTEKKLAESLLKLEEETKAEHLMTIRIKLKGSRNEPPGAKEI